MTAPVQLNQPNNTSFQNSLDGTSNENEKIPVSNTGKEAVKNDGGPKSSGTQGAQINTVQKFISHVRTEYGDTLADTVQAHPQIRDALMNGKPISKRAVQNILNLNAMKLNTLEQTQKLLHQFNEVEKEHPGSVDKNDVAYLKNQISSYKQWLADSGVKANSDVIEGNLKELIDSKALSREQAAEGLQALLVRGEASAEDVQTVAERLDLDMTRFEKQTSSSDTVKNDAKDLHDKTSSNEVRGAPKDLTDMSQYENDVSPRVKTEENLRTMIKDETLTKEQAADTLQSMLSRKELSANDVKTVAANLGLDMSRFEKQGPSSNEVKGAPKDLTDMSQYENIPSQIAKTEANLFEQLQAKTLTKEEAAEALQSLLQRGEVSAEDVKTVSHRLGLDMSRFEAATQGTQSPQTKTTEKTLGKGSGTVHIQQPRRAAAPIQAAPASAESLKAVSDFTVQFMTYLNDTYFRDNPKDELSMAAAREVLAKINVEAKNGQPTAYLASLMRLGDKTLSLNSLIDEFLDQKVILERKSVSDAVLAQADSILAEFKPYYPSDALAEQHLARLTQGLIHDNGFFTSFVAQYSQKDLVPKKDEIARAYVEFCRTSAAETTDKIHGKNKITGTMQKDKLPQVKKVVDSMTGVSSTNLDVGTLYEQNTNTCFMLSVANALCMTQEGVNFLQGWLAENPFDAGSLTYPNFNAFEITLGGRYNENALINHSWKPGDKGFAVQVLDVLGLNNTSGNSINRGDDVFKKQEVWLDASERLARGEMAVVRLESYEHFVAVVGTYGTPSNDTSQFGFIIRDSATGEQRPYSVDEIASHGQGAFSFFEIPKAA